MYMHIIYLILFIVMHDMNQIVYDDRTMPLLREVCTYLE